MLHHGSQRMLDSAWLLVAASGETLLLSSNIRHTMRQLIKGEDRYQHPTFFDCWQFFISYILSLRGAMNDASSLEYDVVLAMRLRVTQQYIRLE